jgi:hypothetical protein
MVGGELQIVPNPSRPHHPALVIRFLDGTTPIEAWYDW